MEAPQVLMFLQRKNAVAVAFLNVAELICFIILIAICLT
jgi:hypothetical protein